MLRTWNRADLTDLADLEGFLIKHEEYCIGFSAWLREKIISTPHLRDFTIFLKRSKEHLHGAASIKEAVLVTEQGLVYPFLSFRNDSAPHGYRELGLYLQHQTSDLNSIIGLSNAVEMIEKLLKKQLRAKVAYHLMFLLDSIYLKENLKIPRGLKIRQATVADASLLFPLQKSYELEEVYLNPSQFNETACYANLKSSLRKEIIYLAEKNGKPVAKAGTNAKGYRVWQIGGVFTKPDERGKGIATILMQNLLSHLQKNRKSAVLFVKKDNPAAINLYTKLGFETIADFRISYLKK